MFSLDTCLHFLVLDEEERGFPEEERTHQEEDGKQQVDIDARVVVHVSAENVAEQQAESRQQKEKCAQSATNPVVVVMSKASVEPCGEIILTTHMSSAISDTKSGMQM